MERDLLELYSSVISLTALLAALISCVSRSNGSAIPRPNLLHLSGVVFRRHWKPPRLQPWEGPFADPTRRLPQAPDVAARRRAARRRWRARQPHARETSNDARGRDVAFRQAQRKA